MDSLHKTVFLSSNIIQLLDQKIKENIVCFQKFSYERGKEFRQEEMPEYEGGMIDFSEDIIESDEQLPQMKYKENKSDPTN